VRLTASGSAGKAICNIDYFENSRILLIIELLTIVLNWSQGVSVLISGFPDFLWSLGRILEMSDRRYTVPNLACNLSCLFAIIPRILSSNQCGSRQRQEFLPKISIEDCYPRRLTRHDALDNKPTRTRARLQIRSRLLHILGNAPRNSTKYTAGLRNITGKGNRPSVRLSFSLDWLDRV